ncbi:ferritin family protein [bacterium]|nr:ferritin family protein [candidate division CSSED10-310 bacterium]
MSDKAMIIGLLDKAIAVEKKGAKLYYELSQSTRDPQVKRLFQRLSGEEMQHYEFVKQLKAYAEKDARWEFEDPEIMVRVGLVTVAEFPQIDPFLVPDLASLGEDASILEALKSSFEAEKKQYTAYRRLSEEFEEQEARNILVHLANEERKHALDLAGEHNRLISGGKK